MAKKSKKKQETKQKATKAKRLTEANIKAIDAIMTGKYLQASISMAKRMEFTKKTGIHGETLFGTLLRLEQMGYIVGYIPMITEDGKRIIDALKQMYGITDETSLSDMTS